MLLSSIYPVLITLPERSVPAFPRRLAMPHVLHPARRVAGAGRGAPVVIGSFYGRHRRFLSPEKHAPGSGAAPLKGERAASVIPVQKSTHRPIRPMNVRFATKLGRTFSIRQITLL
ncbi:hypothetical protein [Burkholderia sp. BCC0419]|uniref:hypothetical protein n=1 Tax=Burkholderia sp. BCC0419 TaxID=486878 RepID=UPI00158BE5A2|nr:hypothetical protein [Burkholderia sp. BCC0419]